MSVDVTYSRRERFWLLALAIFGFVGVNGAFAYGVVFQPGSMEAVMTNPVGAAFVVEAMVLVGVFAYLFRKWGVGRLGWGWFVFLALLGSLAFAVPVVLLYPGRRRGRDTW